MPDFIYPHDFFHSHEGERESGLCFVLMPFADEYRHIYHSAIKPTVEGCGMMCLRADDIYSSRPILVSVMEHIARAEVVIADLSGRNPNVFYEVGMAHVVKTNEAVILVSQTTEDVPFDLRHLRHIVYEDSATGLDRLKTELQKRLLRSRESPPSDDFTVGAAQTSHGLEVHINGVRMVGEPTRPGLLFDLWVENTLHEGSFLRGFRVDLSEPMQAKSETFEPRTHGRPGRFDLPVSIGPRLASPRIDIIVQFDVPVPESQGKYQGTVTPLGRSGVAEIGTPFECDFDYRPPAR